jgi:hypothetical protein
MVCPDLRKRTELIDEQTGKGLVLTDGQPDVQDAGYLVKVFVAGDAPLVVVGAPAGFMADVMLFGIVFIGELADEFFGEVLDSEHPGHSAVLIHDTGQPVVGLTQLNQGSGRDMTSGSTTGSRTSCPTGVIGCRSGSRTSSRCRTP